MSSDLRRKAMSSKLPPLPSFPEGGGGGSEGGSGGGGSGGGGSGGGGSGGSKRVGEAKTTLPWSEFWERREEVRGSSGQRFCVYRSGKSGPLVLLLHGGGYTGLTWSCFLESLKDVLDCQVLAPDLRGHGLTSTQDDYQLSNETLIGDLGDMIVQLFGEAQPPTLVIGHSMGGALAVRLCNSGLLRCVSGVGVVDVVEGSAMEALAGMSAFLRTRPSRFVSETEAIGWCVKSGTVRNVRSARVSMPSQLRGSEGEDGLVWRTELTRTESFWREWFSGLSSAFLSTPCPKLLILAGTDRLDKELMVAQMQGKFQLVLLPKSGHAVQEDQPRKLAEAVATFATRHRLATPKSAFQPSQPAC